MDQKLAYRDPCYLLELPDEVKLEIVRHLTRRHDLYNLSRTCRRFEDITLSRLYEVINLDIPCSNTLKWSKGYMPTFRPFVLQNMRELTIQSGVSNLTNPVYHKRRKSDANSPGDYIGVMLREVTPNRLKAFSFLHPTSMNSQLLNSLSKMHGGGLRSIQCYELELLHRPDISFPKNLRSLECRSVLSGETTAQLIQGNKNTLESLSLGQDRYLMQRYNQRRTGFLNNIIQPNEFFQNAVDFSAMPKLKSISLTGLNLDPITFQATHGTSDLLKLESITLESCLNTAPFLDLLAQTFSSSTSQQPSLTKFSFRHEFVPDLLKNSLLRFLTSFTGLTSLTILIENTSISDTPSALLKNHSKTLTDLTIESRLQPREHLHTDTSRPFGTGDLMSQLWQDNVKDITSLCSNLRELGMAISWDDTAVLQSLQNLGRLKHLKTFHVRNFPSSQSQTEPDTHTIQTCAETLLSHLPKSANTSLETLAIGPTLYTSRWCLESASSASSTTTSTTAAPTSIPSSPPQPPQLPTTTTTNTPSPIPISPPATPRRISPIISAATALSATLAMRGAAKRNPHVSPPSYLRTHYFAIERAADDEMGLKARNVTEREMLESRGGTGNRSGRAGVFEGVWLR